MTSLSIDAQMRSIDQGLKSYLRLYSEFGYELGFGKSGAYAGHAHLFYWDVMFCPKGVTSVDAHSRSQRGTLLIVPPATYFEASFDGPFAFLKFSDYLGTFPIPDKVTEKLNADAAWMYSNDDSVTLAWAPRLGVPLSKIQLQVRRTPASLTITAGNTDVIVVTE